MGTQSFFQSVLLAIIGLASGVAVASGVFAFITMIGVVTRMAARTKTVKHVLLYEDMVVLGGTIGNLAAVFGDKLFFWLRNPGIEAVLIPLFGIFSGVFVGGLSMALAEVLQVFPIFTRRIKLKYGLSAVIVCFAIGKAFGALYQMYFAR